MSLNPRVDFAFKKLFGSEENKPSLLAFINAILPEEEQVTEISFLNPFNDKAYSKDKLSILDIKAVDKQGRQYNIEMQVTDEVNYSQRALYYWSKLYANQLKAGDDYDLLHKTISIHVLNFNCFLNEPDYHNVFHILNAKSHRREFEDMELHFIELEKFDKDFGELKTRLDHWTSFLTTVDQYDHDTMPLVLKNDPDVGPAIEALEHLSLTSDEREVYEARLKWLRDERSAIKKARAEGLTEGMEKGLTEGMEKGRTSEKRMIVRNAVQAGLESSVIAQLTGLSIEEIKRFQDKSEC